MNNLNFEWIPVYLFFDKNIKFSGDYTIVEI